MPSYSLRECPLSVVDELCQRYHGYGSAGGTATYTFAVYEGDKAVAGFAWQPPAPGAAKSVCREQPGGVLALSRMVAVEKSERNLKHISKPLRRQMIRLLDRGRWPVLITYHDEGEGHTGHVYKCSGWQQTKKGELRNFYVDARGRRVSPYSNGKMKSEGLFVGGKTRVHRWEHWICGVGTVADHMEKAGWERVPIPGKVWRSGNQAHRWEKEKKSCRNTGASPQ